MIHKITSLELFFKFLYLIFSVNYKLSKMGFLYKSRYLLVSVPNINLSFSLNRSSSIIKINEDSLPWLEKIWAERIFSIAFSNIVYKMVKEFYLYLLWISSCCREREDTNEPFIQYHRRLTARNWTLSTCRRP